jgi:hypothetical protein
MTARKLTLQKEIVAELTADELSQVAGASHGCVTYSIVVSGCHCTGYYPSLNADCPTFDWRCQG